MHKVEPPGLRPSSADDSDRRDSRLRPCLVLPPDEMLIFGPSPPCGARVAHVRAGSALLDRVLKPLELRPESPVDPSDGMSSHSRTTRWFKRCVRPSLSPTKSV